MHQSSTCCGQKLGCFHVARSTPHSRQQGAVGATSQPANPAVEFYQALLSVPPVPQGEEDEESPLVSPALPPTPLSTFGGFGRPYGPRISDDSINLVRPTPVLQLDPLPPFRGCTPPPCSWRVPDRRAATYAKMRHQVPATAQLLNPSRERRSARSLQLHFSHAQASACGHVSKRSSADATPLSRSGSPPASRAARRDWPTWATRAS